MPLITLPEARSYLSADVSVISDAVLQTFVDASVKVVEGITGPIDVQTRTYTSRGSGCAVALPWRPISITSVTEDGVATTDYTYDLTSGILYGGAVSVPRNLRPGATGVAITAQVGMTDPAANVKLAALEELRFLYQLGQQGTRPGWDGSGAAPDVPSGFAVPNRVIELLGPTRRLPGFA